MLHLFFIINPSSGKGNHSINEETIKTYFDTKKYKINVSYSKYPKHAILLTEEAIKLNPDVIIACGGDGTINEVANRLVNTSIKLGIIPIGSGNGLASNLNIPKNSLEALQIIENNRTTTIDVGKINDTYFFSNMGLGIDAEIIERYQNSGKRNLMSYVKASINRSLWYEPKVFNYSIGNHKLKESLLFLFISNSNEMGYNISLTPNASLSDGYLDLLTVPKLNFFNKLYFGIAVIINKIHTFKKAKHHLIKEMNVDIENTSNCVAQIDGEYHILNTNRISISILERSLNIIIP
ncbi:MULTISPECIES: diacylglycerol/lipid kinase family protein [Flavobacterium]|uniref:Diacylglycerol/lipid kinase family protein n=1 Tax=Flavobacterium jumunjinense TaxID=998845 RepID=A0ABV5GMK2_9FLAO|nr:MULTISPECIES: diacylglycerol kinase family protein [Flavobacterium]